MDSVIVAVYNCNNFNTFYLFTRFICWFKCQASLGLVENWIINLKVKIKTKLNWYLIDFYCFSV